MQVSKCSMAFNVFDSSRVIRIISFCSFVVAVRYSTNIIFQYKLTDINTESVRKLMYSVNTHWKQKNKMKVSTVNNNVENNHTYFSLILQMVSLFCGGCSSGSIV